MSTIRNYLTEQEYSEITNDTINDITDVLIDQAESLIDQACAEFTNSWLARSVEYSLLEEASTATSTTASLSNSYANDYLKYCTVEILSGAKAGSRACITSSTSNSITFDAITSLSGVVAIKIYQTGKFPMKKDTTQGSSVIYKSIPQEIKQAVAWQVKFIVENPKLFKSSLLQSESIGGSYSYTRGSVTDKGSIMQLLSPQTIQLIKPYTLQTI